VSCLVAGTRGRVQVESWLPRAELRQVGGVVAASLSGALQVRYHSWHLVQAFDQALCDLL